MESVTMKRGKIKWQKFLALLISNSNRGLQIYLLQKTRMINMDLVHLNPKIAFNEGDIKASSL